MEEALLKKFLAGAASPEEAKLVLEWINSKGTIKDITRLFDSYNISGPTEEVDAAGILEKIHQRMVNEDLNAHLRTKPGKMDRPLVHRDREFKKIKSPPGKKWQSAVVFFTVMIAAVIVFYLIPQDPRDTNMALGQETNIVKKSTKKGQKLNLRLSDGSRVVLNASSTIIYPENFDGSSRYVELLGEAYFEVSPDSLRPFTVKTGDLETVVLGTSFNVQYRPNIMVNKVALISGSVKVGFIKDKEQEPIKLQSGEMAGIDYKEEKLIRGNFNPEQVSAWRNGIIYFEDAGIDEIISTLENWYGVDIKTAGQRPIGWKFNAKFENESLDTVMEALKYAQNLNYQKEGEVIQIEF